MSRYELTPIDPKHKVVVGWDNQLMTFFVQVLDVNREDDEPPVLWLGCCRGEVPTAAALADLVRPYAVLPEDTQTRLRQDYEARRPPQMPEGLGDLAAALDRAARRNVR